MITRAYCTLMAKYGRWQNEQLLEACAGLDDSVRKQADNSFFGSIHGTLNHLIFGDIGWMTRFETGESAPFGPREEFYAEFSALRDARRALDNRILVWSENLDDGWLDAPFRWTSRISGQSYERPAWQLVVHMFNHQTHHRGQLTDQLARLGVDYGITDLPAMPGS
jgi:uncharacterized damage-inducible protein DinB